MLFTGHFEHTIDAKQRLAIPAEVRAQWKAEEHGGAWYAAPWVGRVIRLFTETAFKKHAAEYARGLTPDQDEAELITTLFGLSARLEMDSAGRIRLPEDMLQLAELGTEVVLVGAGEWLEIRDRAEWRQKKAERLRQLPDLLRKVRENGHAGL